MLRITVFIFLALSFCFGGELRLQNEFKADFVQEIISPENTTIRYEGKVYFKAPDYLRWDYFKPIKKSVYIAHKNVVVYEPELEQAIIKGLSEELSLSRILKNSTPLSEGKFVSKFEEKEYVLEMEGEVLKSITFEDILQNKVVIRFENTDIKSELDKSLFLFVPENGVDVIYQ